ncbi:MAG: hypothetical protein JEZ14_11315 [Marinilabiliaceae bacterium]|nr:hypothetical protein [Marinilabiliaceae bacterium]
MDEKNMITILSFILAGISILISAYLTWSNNKLRKEEQEKALIKKRLDEFYAPFLMLRYESKNLYKIFTKGKPEGFRTLRAVLNNEVFNETEQELLKEILLIGNKCKDLIVQKSGLIDKPELRDDILPRYITHIYILESACKDRIKGDTADYDDFVFPREMDESILQHIVFLKGLLTGRWERMKTKIERDLDFLTFKTLTPIEKIKLNKIKNRSTYYNDRVNACIISLRNKKYSPKEICNILDINTVEVENCLKSWEKGEYLKLFYNYSEF